MSYISDNDDPAS